jgi:hypothetical protein
MLGLHGDMNIFEFFICFSMLRYLGFGWLRLSTPEEV